MKMVSFAERVKSDKKKQLGKKDEAWKKKHKGKNEWLSYQGVRFVHVQWTPVGWKVYPFGPGMKYLPSDLKNKLIFEKSDNKASKYYSFSTKEKAMKRARSIMKTIRKYVSKKKW